MVSRIFISIALLCSSIAFSQEESALKFNQVLLVDMPNSVSVPADKVWKIESALVSCSQHCTASILVNENYVAFYSWGVTAPSSGDGAASSNHPTNFPIWLPTGTQISNSENISSLSIIEFDTD